MIYTAASLRKGHKHKNNSFKIFISPKYTIQKYGYAVFSGCQSERRVGEMARPKSDIQREPLSMRVKWHVVKYVVVKASVLGISYNTLLENALIKFLDTTRNMSKMDVYKLCCSPVKIPVRRMPITTTIQSSIQYRAKALAKTLGVLFAEVVEAALQDRVYADLDDIKTGRLNSGVIEEALREYLNVELQNMKKVLPEFERHLKEAEIKYQSSFFACSRPRRGKN